MYQFRYTRLQLMFCVVLLAAMMAGTTGAQPTAPADPTAVPADPAAVPADATPAAATAAQVHAAQANRRFVPFTGNGTVPNTVFGLEMAAVLPERNLDAVAQLGSAWVRRNGLLWKDVESIEGRGYVWTRPSVVALEREMIAASNRGLRMILVVRGSPRWATAPYTADCAPIAPSKYGAFAAFMSAAVKRYSQPPYNVKFWELGNEPDGPIGADSQFGCWGKPGDPYFGGREYGNMLKAVYPAIKAANASVTVLNGSVLLEKAEVPMATFMEGVFVAGAANSFDILGFHSYCMHDPNNTDGHDVYFRSCATDWKVPFLRRLTAKYGVPNKQMMRTEAGLLCSPTLNTTICRSAQAQWVARAYTRTARDGVLNSIWYGFDIDWQQGALVEPVNPYVPRPAFVALQQAASMFSGAEYLGIVPGQPAGVEGYQFRRSGQTISALWSNRPQNTNVAVTPGVPISCYGRDGQALPCANNGGAVGLTLGPSVVYVVSP